jgi:hypothetical protein
MISSNQTLVLVCYKILLPGIRKFGSKFIGFSIVEQILKSFDALLTHSTANTEINKPLIVCTATTYVISLLWIIFTYASNCSVMIRVI